MRRDIIPLQPSLHIPNSFYRRILRWFDQYGRKHLPWQQNPTPYRVWISEIMLQQTQVNTVIPYYEAFMAQFPNVEALAAADIDSVLHRWTGLGYYARARNLHRTAQLITTDYHGEWPNTVEELSSLPGIGRSTAGAILSLGMQQRAAILDGNVKRVLARSHQVKGWPGQSKVQDTLWSISEHYTPKNRCHHYNQAMMDLGATVCKRSQPNCDQCPIKRICISYSLDQQHLYPSPKPKKAKPVKTVYLLMITTPSALLLEKRPEHGIWGGLWSLPEIESLDQLKAYCSSLGCSTVSPLYTLLQERHTFSHYHLDYTPVMVQLKRRSKSKQPAQEWFSYKQPISVGLPAPIVKLIDDLKAHSSASKPQDRNPLLLEEHSL